MGNMVNIAKKEFGDILGSKIVIVIILVFLFMFVITIFQNYLNYEQYGLRGGEYTIRSLFGVFIAILADYGSMVALVLGFSTIYNERKNNALNTLLAKPLYRDTIINGKLAGTFVFLLCLTIFSAVMYISLLLILYGSVIMPYIQPFSELLPLALLISFVTMIIIYSLAVLISLTIKDTAMALSTCVLLWIVVFNIIPSVNFAGDLAFIFGDNQDQVVSLLLLLSPKGIANIIIGGSRDLSTTIGMSMNYLLVLLAYLVITVVVSYIVFLRRDVS